MSSKLNDIADLTILAGIPAPTTALATSVTGAGVDMSQLGVDCFCIQNVGSASSTSVTLSGKVQEASTSTGTYADIAGATFAVMTSTTGANIIGTVKFLRTLPWVRYVGIVAGTTPVITLNVELGGMKVQA